MVGLKGLRPENVARAAGRYLKQHPEELVRAAKNAAQMKLGVPIAVFRWFAGQLRGASMPRDLVIEARPPGIHAAASLDLMKTPVRASGTIYIERIDLSPNELIVELRLADIALQVLDPNAETPVALLLKSGALDLSRPGDLVAYVPKRPPFLLESSGDRVVLDLMKHPKLSRDRAKKLVGLVVRLVGVDSVRTLDDHLDIDFRALPRGAAEVLAQLRRFF